MRKFYCLLTIGCCLWFQENTAAQSGPCTDISKIGLIKFLDKDAGIAFIGKDDDLTIQPAFQPLDRFAGNIAPSLVSRNALLRFGLSNSADTAASVYFFPGFYYENIRLYTVSGSGILPIPAILPNNPDSIGYRLISIPAHDSILCFARLTFIKTYLNVVRPRLLQPAYLDSYVTQLHDLHSRSDLLTYVFCGLLLMMIFFSMANFLQGANPEYLYYSGYAFFIGFMLFTKALYDFHSSRTNFFLEGFLDFILQGLGLIFYMLFMKWFLDTRVRHRFLYILYTAGIFILCSSLLTFTLFHYFTDNYSAENFVENATKTLLLGMIVIFLVYGLNHWKDRLLRYLFWGNLFLFVFSLFSQAIIAGLINVQGWAIIFRSSLFYYEIGLLFELLFFLAALNYKNREKITRQARERERLEAENRLSEYQKEIAVYKAQQEERERISADMHDELGSGMTAIRLLSEIARNKMKENTPVEIEKISHSANDVLNKMNAIIWSMNSGNDTLDNLISYIRSYSLEYFENTPIQCKVITPEQIPNRELAGDKRRNIFLCVKETLNNVWKHSACTSVQIEISTTSDLNIRISDNGKGIDMKNLRQFGTGLKNIARRMESIGGNFHIENNGGTVTILQLSLDPSFADHS